jgi:hypothetical protein
MSNLQAQAFTASQYNVGFIRVSLSSKERLQKIQYVCCSHDYYVKFCNLAIEFPSSRLSNEKRVSSG